MNRTPTSFGLVALACALGATVSSPALAAGAVDAPSSPVAALRARLPELERTKRGRFPAITPLVRELGADALPALLAEIRHAGPRPNGISDDTWSAWRAGVIEGVGALRRPESRATLEGALGDPQADLQAVRAAVEALGKVADDRIAADLARLARTPGPRQAAALGGMGACRRVVCVEAVGAALASGQLDVATAKNAARALGRAGSAWAWQTSELRDRPEQDAVRRAAARALLMAFERFDGEVRQTAANALTVVGHPDTPALIAAARASAPAERAQALDALDARFARDNQGR